MISLSKSNIRTFSINQFLLVWIWTFVGICAVSAGRPDKLGSTKTTPDVCRCSYIYQKTSKNATRPPVAPWEAIILRTDKKDKNEAPKKICSGSILNDRMILTSVSCAKKSRIVGVPIEQAKRSSKPILKESDFRSQQELTTDNLQVWLGVRNDTFINETGGKSFSVDQILVHPNFAETFGTIMDSDFAILILKERVDFGKFPQLSPACLLPPDFQLELRGQRVRTHFWRFTEPFFDYGFRDTLPTQFVAHLTTSYLFPNQQCKTKALKKEWISDKYVCHSEGRRTLSGGGHFIELSNGYPVLIGMGSYQSLYGTPGVQDFKQIALISSVADGRQFIEDHVSSLKSYTCSVEVPDLSPPASGYNDKALDDLEPYEFGSRPWFQFTSEYRRLLQAEDGCKCGIKKDTTQSTSSKKGRVWRGEDVKTPYEYPWHCNELWAVVDIYSCGCSIINNKLLVTAGHCVAPSNKHFIRDVAYAKLRGKDAFNADNTNDTYFLEYRFVKEKGEILLHPFYGRGQFQDTRRNGTIFEYDSAAFDIGILVLNHTQQLELGKVPDIGAVCLPYSAEDLDVIGKEAQLVGNGYGSNGVGLPNTIQIVPKFMKIKLSDLNSCRKQMLALLDYRLENGDYFVEYDTPLYRTSLCTQETNATNYVGVDKMIQIGVASKTNLPHWLSAKPFKWPLLDDNRITQTFAGLLEHENLSYLDMVAFYHNASWCARYCRSQDVIHVLTEKCYIFDAEPDCLIK